MDNKAFLMGRFLYYNPFAKFLVSSYKHKGAIMGLLQEMIQERQKQKYLRLCRKAGIKVDKYAGKYYLVSRSNSRVISRSLVKAYNTLMGVPQK